MTLVFTIPAYVFSLSLPHSSATQTYPPQIYDPGSNYTFPGGPVANLAGTDASMAAAYTGPTVFPSGTAVSALPAPTGGGASQPAAASPAYLCGAKGPLLPLGPADDTTLFNPSINQSAHISQREKDKHRVLAT